MENIHQTIGLGSTSFELAIYVANRPPLDHYPLLDHLQPMHADEIAYIVGRCSNHWRKLFNVYAKFLFELRGVNKDINCHTWQCYRDSRLLQDHSREALLFSSPNFSAHLKSVHIVAGKTYAAQLNLPFSLDWQNKHFAINKQHKLIVCPYLDYRQLSNARIAQLVHYVKQLN